MWGDFMSEVLCSRFFIAFLFLAVATSPCFSQGKRVALVIGNSAYKHTAVLANPANDAEDIAKTFTGLGFQVTKAVNLNKTEMDRAVTAFAAALKGAEVGVFFYAGHGMQVSGQNYLVPTDATLEASSALDFETVRLDAIQRIMEQETPTNVLFLDACRDNPLTRNLARSMGTRSGAIGKGLAAQESGAGTIISYSTQPGNVALDGAGERNSPYAGALIKRLPAEGRDLSSVLVNVRNDVMAATAKRQVPWEHSALTNELVLAGKAAGRAAEVAGKTAETGTRGGGEKPDATSNAAGKLSLQLPKGQLTYRFNNSVRFHVTDMTGSTCYFRYADVETPQMSSVVVSLYDFVKLKMAGVTYRAMLMELRDGNCFFDVMPLPAGG
jgi:hypothetical protein